MEIKPTLTTISTDSADTKQNPKAHDGAAPVKLQAAVERSDRITLTGIAETLNQLEVELQNLEGIDTNRVEQLRQAIEDGSYEIEVDRLVQNLLQTEKDLAE